MLGVNLRPAVAKVWAPVVRTLVRLGVTADAITLTGTLGAVGSAVFGIGNGFLFWGALAVTLFVLLDMLDGALARARGGGSVFGAVLDSTGDRAADAAIFAGLAWWFSGAGDNRMVVWLALTCLVLGVLTSYVKARAEGMGLRCDVGLVERTERLILILVGTGFTGLGVPYALQVCLWVLLVGSTITVGQRFVEVHRQSRGHTLTPSSALRPDPTGSSALRPDPTDS